MGYRNKRTREEAERFELSAVAGTFLLPGWDSCNRGMGEVVFKSGTRSPVGAVL